MNDYDWGNVLDSYADEDHHHMSNGNTVSSTDSDYYHKSLYVHEIVAETPKSFLLRFKGEYQVRDYSSRGHFSIAKNAEYWVPKKIVSYKIEYSKKDAEHWGARYSFSIHTGILNKIVSN